MRSRGQELVFRRTPPLAVAGLVAVVVAAIWIATPGRWPVIALGCGAALALGWLLPKCVQPAVTVAPQGLIVDGNRLVWEVLDAVQFAPDARLLGLRVQPAHYESEPIYVEQLPELIETPATIVFRLPPTVPSTKRLPGLVDEIAPVRVEVLDTAPAEWRTASPPFAVPAGPST